MEEEQLASCLRKALTQCCPVETAKEALASAQGHIRRRGTGGKHKGPDVECKVARWIFHRSKALQQTRPDKPKEQEIEDQDEQEDQRDGFVTLEVRSEMGAWRLKRHESAKSVAEDILLCMPSSQLQQICVDARATEEGDMLFTTKSYAVELREQGFLQCSQCGLFKNGKRGLRDHQIVSHGESYKHSVSAAASAELALMVFAPEEEPTWLQLARERGRLKRQERDQHALRLDSTVVDLVKKGDLPSLQRSIDPETLRTFVDENDSSALDWAAGCGHLDIVQYLVSNCGCDPSRASACKKGLGRTPLHWACRKGQLHVVKYLVEVCGGDLNARMSDQSTPFHYAVYGDQVDVCEYLEKAGADIHSLNEHKCNAVQWAALSGSTKMLEHLKMRRLDFTLRNKNGHSVLHKAAQRGHLNACRWLLDHIDHDFLRERDATGLLPADLADLNNHRDVAKYLRQKMN